MNLGFKLEGNSSWRGVDLSARIEKIFRVYDFHPITKADEMPIIVNTPAYFLYGTSDKPEDYARNPKSMYEYQAVNYERHLQHVDDDMVPYFMPWFGTGVLSSAFGVAQKEPQDPKSDWMVGDPIVHHPADIAKLKIPDPCNAGLMPRVLECIDYATDQDDLPVGLTDIQGPLDSAGQICGHTNLYLWMATHPEEIKALLELITEALIHWVKVQKKHIKEPLNMSNGLQGVYSPRSGIWASEDDLVMIGPREYEKFLQPCITRLFEEFESGSLHYCGGKYQHLDQILNPDHVAVINNSPMGNFESFHQLRSRIAGKIVHQVQDIVPQNIEEYYQKLLMGVDDFRGLMFVPMLIDELAMLEDGSLEEPEWQPFEAANRVVKSIRLTVQEKIDQPE